jgi:hypothetical protein
MLCAQHLPWGTRLRKKISSITPFIPTTYKKPPPMLWAQSGRGALYRGSHSLFGGPAPCSPLPINAPPPQTAPHFPPLSSFSLYLSPLRRFVATSPLTNQQMSYMHLITLGQFQRISGVFAPPAKNLGKTLVNFGIFPIRLTNTLCLQALSRDASSHFPPFVALQKQLSISLRSRNAARNAPPTLISTRNPNLRPRFCHHGQAFFFIRAKCNMDLPSRLDSNPMVWMLQVNGMIVDVRALPREVQVESFERGMIPYVPADRNHQGENGR